MIEVRLREAVAAVFARFDVHDILVDESGGTAEPAFILSEEDFAKIDYETVRRELSKVFAGTAKVAVSPYGDRSRAYPLLARQ